MNNHLSDNKKLQLINTLDGNVRQIELTKTQQEQLEVAYNSVAKWLADSNHPLLVNVKIYPQGSVRLRTTVRPIGQDEFDVDLVCFIPGAILGIHSAEYIYQLVGQRLKEHATYTKMLEPKNRCWRLDYSDGSRFHMDITPAMPNPACNNEGILVPDRERKQLKPSNPIGYADIFNDISKLVPYFKSLESIEFVEALKRASIEPLPDPMQPKDFLRRIVQLSKRHRDIYFQHRNSYPPISIILTTLAMDAYAALTTQVFEDPWQFVFTVIQTMPLYVRETSNGFVVPNPSTNGENFAEKWNQEHQRVKDFKDWHQQFVDDMNKLVNAQGFDQASKLLSNNLIGPESSAWQKSMIAGITAIREDGGLFRMQGTGGITSFSGTPVQKNTFFGD